MNDDLSLNTFIFRALQFIELISRSFCITHRCVHCWRGRFLPAARQNRETLMAVTVSCWLEKRQCWWGIAFYRHSLRSADRLPSETALIQKITLKKFKILLKPLTQNLKIVGKFNNTLKIFFYRKVKKLKGIHLLYTYYTHSLIAPLLRLCLPSRVIMFSPFSPWYPNSFWPFAPTSATTKNNRIGVGFALDWGTSDIGHSSFMLLCATECPWPRPSLAIIILWYLYIDAFITKGRELVAIYKMYVWMLSSYVMLTCACIFAIEPVFPPLRFRIQRNLIYTFSGKS